MNYDFRDKKLVMMCLELNTHNEFVSILVQASDVESKREHLLRYIAL